jgi:hypothetical protein
MSVSSLTVPVERFLHSQTQQTQKRYSNISLFTSPVPLIPSLQHTAINCMSLPTLDELSMEYTDTHFLLPSNIIDSVYVRSRYGINPRSTTEFNDPPISPINISVSRYLLHAVNILNGYTNGMITKDGLEYHFANEDLVSEDENVLIPATIKRKKKTKKHLTKNIISLLLSITEDDRSTDPRFFESIETPKTSSFPLQVSSFLLGNQLVNRIESAEFRNAFLKNIV